MYQLVIKPTSKCNFNCSFCSSKYLDIKATSKVDSKLKDYIIELNPNELIITGGDPLCVPPEWYFDLLDFYKGRISLTSNLYDFYLYPNKWYDLFILSNVFITTSFQIGGGRLINNQVYDRKSFTQIMNTFSNNFNYVPYFISILDDTCDVLWKENVLLAKELGTKCKLNGVLPLGKSKAFYDLSKLYNIWCDVIEQGLDEYELNCCNRFKGICNLNTGQYNCKDVIRCCWVSNNQLKVGFCEDIMSNNIQIKNSTIKPECIYCVANKLCNSCHLKRSLITDINCNNMIDVYKRMKKLGFKI